MQREGCWVGFAGFAGAAEEVESQELHGDGVRLDWFLESFLVIS